MLDVVVAVKAPVLNRDHMKRALEPTGTSLHVLGNEKLA